MEVCFIDAILMQVFDAPQTLDVDVVHLRIKETASVAHIHPSAHMHVSDKGTYLVTIHNVDGMHF